MGLTSRCARAASKRAEVAEYHTNPCVEIVTQGLTGGPTGAIAERRGITSAPAKTQPAPEGAGCFPSPVFQIDQELALSTVTARRFWDQQDISLHTATGRSLP
jgi:hypothetical protein